MRKGGPFCWADTPQFFLCVGGCPSPGEYPWGLAENFQWHLKGVVCLYFLKQCRTSPEPVPGRWWQIGRHPGVLLLRYLLPQGFFHDGIIHFRQRLPEVLPCIPGLGIPCPVQWDLGKIPPPSVSSSQVICSMEMRSITPEN